MVMNTGNGIVFGARGTAVSRPLLAGRPHTRVHRASPSRAEMPLQYRRQRCSPISNGRDAPQYPTAEMLFNFERQRCPPISNGRHAPPILPDDMTAISDGRDALQYRTAEMPPNTDGRGAPQYRRQGCSPISTAEMLTNIRQRCSPISICPPLAALRPFVLPAPFGGGRPHALARSPSHVLGPHPWLRRQRQRRASWSWTTTAASSSGPGGAAVSRPLPAGRPHARVRWAPLS